MKKYGVILNRKLPEDIRVIDCVEVEDSFNARFDCLSREYMYFFMRRTLDVERMEEACKYLEGKHDFRNLCRANVVQQDHFERRIMHAGIYPASCLLFGDGDKANLEGPWQAPKERPPLTQGSPFDMFYLRVRGNAFLWNQVVMT